MKVSAVIVFAVLASCVGCNRQDQGYAGPSGPLSRVFIDSAGTVSLNGHAVDSATLADSLHALAALRGGVIYSRANPDRDPSAIQEPVTHRVMKEIVRNKLPVRLVRPESLLTAGK